MSRAAGVIVMAASVVLLASCSNSEAGTPRADSGATATTESDDSSPSSPGPDTPTSNGDSSLNDIEPCELLSAAEVSELGVAAGEYEKVGETRRCSWTKSGDYGFHVSLHTDFGVEEANLDGYEVTLVDIGEHEARQAVLKTGGEGECAVLVAVSDSSYVDIGTTASGLKDTPKACGVAVRVAKIIDPKLP